MKRALQLAEAGEGRVAPNPMVGAVIVADGKIIGEGYHARYGRPHAEVNAVNSVRETDRHLLKEATVYVTLEPCAHFGKTPPCADLLIREKVKRVVVASPDPNPLVSGKGVERMREAGIEVEEGVLRDEADFLNRRFLKAHREGRPWILLKWAQSADGFMAAFADSCGVEPNSSKEKEGVIFRESEEGCEVGYRETCPVKFSNEVSSVWMHRERTRNQAIMVGSNTLRIDEPRLDARLWGGGSPIKVKADSAKDLKTFLMDLRKEGIVSLMVEGGPTLLNSFIKENLFDEIRLEISPKKIEEGLKAPVLPSGLSLMKKEKCGENLILILSPEF